MQGLDKGYHIFMHHCFCEIIEPAPREVVDQPKVLGDCGKRGKPQLLQVADNHYWKYIDMYRLQLLHYLFPQRIIICLRISGCRKLWRFKTLCLSFRAAY